MPSRWPAKRGAIVANVDNTTRLMLESIFEMSGGYVLDFTNASFGDFVKNAIGDNPYEKYDGTLSKARLLRAIWDAEPDAVVAKLNLDLLEHWRVSKLLRGEEPTSANSKLHDELKSQFAARAPVVSTTDLAFLARDFGEINLTKLPGALTAREVVDARLKEIDACLSADAPLAVIFLVGSTLEGLLLELAKANATQFTTSANAPKDRASGKARPLDQWRLADLIATAHLLKILSDDVFKFADHVRGFRNYIHPRQQLAEGFEPRKETAQIAYQVLIAALADLQLAAAVMEDTP